MRQHPDMSTAADRTANIQYLEANCSDGETEMEQLRTLASLGLDYPSEIMGCSLIANADCFEWFRRIPKDSIHGIVTDPPYGVKEYESDQLEKRENGNGGVWRIPPSFDGHKRSPLPRFTALTDKERGIIRRYFAEWAKVCLRALRPGGHVFIAGNAYLSQLVFPSLVEGGLEFRGELIRLVRTFRGGDRPKNAEREFPAVSSMARGSYEPWGILRKPIPRGMTVSQCLREFQTGGLRRYPDGRPFRDVIQSERTPRRERCIANHPSLKPQSFLRQLVYAVLPLGEGIVADPFMGSGSTVAAAMASGIHCVGIERRPEYYEMSQTAIPKLATMETEQTSTDQGEEVTSIRVKPDDNVTEGGTVHSFEDVTRESPP